MDFDGTRLWRSRVPRQLIIAVVVLLLVAAVLVVPSATVVVVLPLRHVETIAAVEGSPLDTGSVERREVTVPATGRIEAAPARGVVRFGFDTATGFEVFDLFGSLPRPPRLITVPAGTIVEACAARHRRPCPGDRIAFETLDDAVLDRSKETCFFFDCQVESPRVRITALADGPQGNVREDAIRFVDLPNPERAGRIYVFNPLPTRGGTFERYPFVSREDVANATLQLEARLKPLVLGEIEEQAAREDLEITLLRYVRSKTVAPDVGTDSEEVTVVLDMGARAWGYSRAELEVTMLRQLEAAAPTGHHVIEDSATFDEDSARFDREGPGFFGAVEFTVEGLAASLDADAVVSDAVAHAPSSVSDRLLEEPGVESVAIRQWPVPLPLLPLVPWRIEVVFEDSED